MKALKKYIQKIKCSLTLGRCIFFLLWPGKDTMNSDTIENNFTYHPPKNNQVQRYGKIRGHARELAHHILRECPDSREKSLAMTKLEEAVMWANAAIARNE